MEEMIGKFVRSKSAIERGMVKGLRQYDIMRRYIRKRTHTKREGESLYSFELPKGRMRERRNILERLYRQVQGARALIES